MKNLNSLEINKISGGTVFSPFIISSIEFCTSKKFNKTEQNIVKYATALTLWTFAGIALSTEFSTANKVFIVTELAGLGYIEIQDKHFAEYILLVLSEILTLLPNS